MYIYHYSREFFKDLRTLKAQGKDPVNAHRKDYGTHISFFFDPLPLKKIAGLFKNEHPFYQMGEGIYEYVVNVNILGDIKYDVVESPGVVKIRDDFPWRSNTQESDQEIIEFRKLKDAYKEKEGETGVTLSGLKKQIALYRGKSFDYFRESVKRSDFDDNRTKYAANVPHVMLFPKNGVIKYDHVNAPDGKKDHIKQPKYATW